MSGPKSGQLPVFYYVFKFIGKFLEYLTLVLMSPFIFLGAASLYLYSQYTCYIIGHGKCKRLHCGDESWKECVRCERKIYE